MLLSDFFNMLAMAVFACIGGVFLGMGFLLLKLAGIFFGILAIIQIGGVYYSDGSGRKVDFPFDGGVSPLFPAMKGIPVRFP